MDPRFHGGAGSATTLWVRRARDDGFVGSFTRMSDLWQDLRLALRAMARQKALFAAALASLALGIGANTRAFSRLKALRCE